MSGTVWERELIESPCWEGWETIHKETRAPRGHTRWVCELRKLGISMLSKPLGHLMSPHVRLGGLWDEDAGGKEMVPTSLHGGVGREGWMQGGVSQRRGEKTGQAQSDQTTGSVPNKSKCPASAWHGTWSRRGSPFLCCQHISPKPAGETSRPSATPVHKQWRHEVRVAVVAHYRVWSQLAQIVLFPTVPRGRLLHFSGLLMFFSHSFWERRIGMVISDLFFPKVNVVLHKLWICVFGKLVFNASGMDFDSTHWPSTSQYLLLQKRRPRIKT